MMKPSILDISSDLAKIEAATQEKIDLSSFTDIHICANETSKSLIFPGPRHPDQGELDLVDRFLRDAESNKRSSFMFQLEGFSFRGERIDKAIDGTWYRLRRLPVKVPTLENLPSALPDWYGNLLLDENLRKGGLLYFIGSPAQGKTTTASATLASRLRKFGGYALTIEDPPEMPLNGWHLGSDGSQKGYCSQTWVGDQPGDSWGDAIKGALRSMPANTPSMLYIGEVRDAECAATMLRAACNGFLVLATGFGTDIISGLQSLQKIAGDTEITRQMLGNSLRMTSYLQITEGVLRPKILLSESINSSVANKLRNGDFAGLQNDINLQSSQIKKNIDLGFTR